MRKKLLFISVLLFVCVSPLFSQDYILVPRITLEKLLSLEMSTQAKISLLESELNKAKKELTESNESITKSDEEIKSLKIYIQELETALTDLNKIHDQELKSLKSYYQKEQIKTGFIVGGVCITVTAIITAPIAIYIYQKLNK